MLDDAKGKNLSIVTIPRYIWNNLCTKGKGITYLDNLITELKSANNFQPLSKVEIDIEHKNKNAIMKDFVSTVSDSDLQDIIFSDYLLAVELLGISSFFTTLSRAIISCNYNKFGYIHEVFDRQLKHDLFFKKFVEFKNILTNDEIEKTYNFIMSINTSSPNNDLFEIIAGENSIFVILNSGFCNYFSLDHIKQTLFKLEFLKVFYNKLYRTYGADTANYNYGLLEKLTKVYSFTTRYSN